jgi:glycosyltransferase involved in cell wall biosynthesis
MGSKNTVLITCSRLVDLAGAEVTTLELVEAFGEMGWVVSVAAYELGGNMQLMLDSMGARYFDLTNEDAFETINKFDLAWLHHSATAYRVLLDKFIKVDKVVFSSLSYFEPIESPPISALTVSRYLVNSHENLNYFIDKYPAFQATVSVFHNSTLAKFWSEDVAPTSPSLRRLAIVSNHIPEEVRQLAPLLAERHVSVDIFGLDGRRERVTPQRLLEYDAVITIGKTVQYCIASNIPVYCYDHFGGNGWLNPESFDRERIHNFSGRGGRGRIDVLTLLAELQEGYGAALGWASILRKQGRRYFVLEENIANVLAEMGANFSATGISETDRHIISRQNQIYLKQRNILSNLNQIVIERDEQIANLNQIVIERDEQIANLNQIVIERDEQIANLNQIVIERDEQIANLATNIKDRDNDIVQLKIKADELVRVQLSYSWRMTRPLRRVARWLVQNRDGLMARISWGKFLLLRSIAVIRHQGVYAFFYRAKRYTSALVQRKNAARRSKTFAHVHDVAEAEVGDQIIASFIIPVYDRTDVLRIAINSALNQSISNIEVIVVTDGSPKETMDVVNEYSENSKVRIFNYPRSSGNAVRGRNKGIAEARGRYIAFLDSDDVAVPDRLERCLSLLESGDADVVYGAWQAILDGSRDVQGIKDGQIVYSPNADLKMLVDACIPCQSTVIVRKSLFETAGLLKPTMQYREDHELWARLAFYGGVFRSIPDVLTKLRLHSGNNELNFKDSDNHWLNLLKVEYRKVGPKPKKIGFILPGVGISGGIAVVFKHAELLMNAGHDAFVINVGEVGDGRWFTNNSVPIVHISDPRPYIFQGIDLLIATGWSTAEWLDRFRSERKLYFVQSDERRFYDEEALKRKVHETYLTPCEYFTEALWIKKMLRDEFGHDAAYVPNGIDTSQFFPDVPLEPKPPGKLRILLEGPIVIPFKGLADSYAAIEGLDCEVWIVSSAGRPPIEWKYARFFEGVPFGEMRKIYSSCDIFLKMSRIEGFFGPPMEAMACGCSVVVGKVTGYEEYIVDEVNALVVEQGDVHGARRAVERLIDDDFLRNRLIQGGRDTVLDWGWARSAHAMLSLVNKTQFDG